MASESQDQTRNVHDHALDKRLILVSPHNTAEPQALTEVDIPNADLLWFWSSSVSEIPERLDIDRLRTSLAKTLAVYRTACGRIRKNGTVWKVLLTDSPFPIEVVECANPPHFDEKVGQSSKAISGLLPHMSAAPHEVINADLPLVSLKVTVSAEKTMLGICWHHALGDAGTRLRFMSLHSRYYQGLDPLYPLPSFVRHHFWNPATEDNKDPFAFMRELGASSEIPKAEHMVASISSESPNVAVHWIVPRAKANILQENIQQSLGSKVSVQDCLTAYVVSAVTQCGHVIRRVNCTIGWRGVSPEWAKPDVAGNMATLASTGTFEEAIARDPCQVALKLRQLINTFRKPEFIAEYMRKDEQFFFAAAEKGDWTAIYACALIPDTLATNHMAGLTWQESVNFGNPAAKYYAAHFLELPFSVRIFPANPTAERSASDAFEVLFAVPQSMHSKILEKLEEDNYLSPFN